MATRSRRDALPRQGDCIEITWLASKSKDQCLVQDISDESLTVMYMDNGDIEELEYDDGHLPFEWKLYSPPPQPIQVIESSLPSSNTSGPGFNSHPTQPPVVAGGIADDLFVGHPPRNGPIRGPIHNSHDIQPGFAEDDEYEEEEYGEDIAEEVDDEEEEEEEVEEEEDGQNDVVIDDQYYNENSQQIQEEEEEEVFDDEYNAPYSEYGQSQNHQINQNNQRHQSHEMDQSSNHNFNRFANVMDQSYSSNQSQRDQYSGGNQNQYNQHNQYQNVNHSSSSMHPERQQLHHPQSHQQSQPQNRSRFPSNQERDDRNNYSNNHYGGNSWNKSKSQWQPKQKHVPSASSLREKDDYFQKKRYQYDQQQQQQQQYRGEEREYKQSQSQSHSQSQSQTQYQSQSQNSNAMQQRNDSKKESTPQRTIARTVSDITMEDNHDEPQRTINGGTTQYHEDQYTDNRPKPKSRNYDPSRIPMKGDTVEICYSGGMQHDPVRVITSNYRGDARVRYDDERGAENKVNLLRNRDISFQITQSVYDDPDIEFIPCPREGDTVEIRWIDNGGRDIVNILSVDVQYTDEWIEKKENEKKEESKDTFDDDATSKRDIRHFDKFKSMMVTFQYPDDLQEETLDFHPNHPEQEVVLWRTTKCGDRAGIVIYDDEMKSDDLLDDLCAVCATPFREFPYRTVVPCPHNDVCAKCTLRMRYFAKFDEKNASNPKDPECPQCKVSWKSVAFVPLSWSIAMLNHFESDPNIDSSPSNLAKLEWNTVFSRPLEYDAEIGCYFTDICTLQLFIHLRSLYCLVCNPVDKPITNFSKVYYYHNVGKLMQHLRTKHGHYQCELCLNNARLFVHEQRLFQNKKALFDHEKFGSRIEDDYGETAPHPFCTLCRRNFYDRDALFDHCEDSHASCHLCKASGIWEYYATPKILMQHHRDFHHLCEHPECLAKLQPVVFDDPVLLQHHQSQVHRWHKPVSNVRTAFRYGDEDRYANRGGKDGNNGTMNFSTMFSANDIHFLNMQRYGAQGNPNINRRGGGQAVLGYAQQPEMSLNEEQKLQQLQRQNHATMEAIKRRWFPQALERERLQQNQQRKRLQLGLKHIPDAVPPEERDKRHKAVCLQIRKILVSELNWKRFGSLTASYKMKKSKPNEFFYRFKAMFKPLCTENVWVGILIEMLALLEDGKLRRSLYEQYRYWVVTGRDAPNHRRRECKVAPSRSRMMKNVVNSQSMNNRANSKGTGGTGSTTQSVKAKKTNVRNAASIVGGTFKPKSKEMIASEQRAKKMKATKASKAAKAKAYLGGGSGSGSGSTPGGPGGGSSNQSATKPQGAWAVSSASSAPSGPSAVSSSSSSSDLSSNANPSTSPKGPPPPASSSKSSKKSKAAAYLGGTTPGGPSTGTSGSGATSSTSPTAGGPPAIQRSARRKKKKMKAVTIPASEWADIRLTTTQIKTANKGAKLKIQKKKSAPKRASNITSTATSSTAAAIRSMNIAAGGTKGQWGKGSAAAKLKPKPKPKPKPVKKVKPKAMPKRRGGPAPQQMQKGQKGKVSGKGGAAPMNVSKRKPTARGMGRMVGRGGKVGVNSNRTRQPVPRGMNKKHFPDLVNGNGAPVAAPKVSAKWVDPKAMKRGMGKGQSKKTVTSLKVIQTAPSKPKPVPKRKELEIPKNLHLYAKPKKEEKATEEDSNSKSKKKKKKKSDHGPRVKPEDLFKPIDDSSNNSNDASKAKKGKNPLPPQRLIPTPMGGQMPHEKGFNKGTPWGKAPKSTPRTAKIGSILSEQDLEKEAMQKQKQMMQMKANSKLLKQKGNSKQKQNQKGNNNPKQKQNSNSNSKQKQKQKGNQQQKSVKSAANKNASSGDMSCYFGSVLDAQAEMQSVFIKFTSSTLKESFKAKKDKIGMFLVFLIEFLYPKFQSNFSSHFRYESTELRKRYRQHIYQAMYKKIWSPQLTAKSGMVVVDDKGGIELKEASYVLVGDDNMFSWQYLVNVPNLNEEIATRIGGLYEMLVAIDDEELDMSPLQIWVDQMEFTITQVYPLLLYIWFLMEKDLPAAPYPFIQKPKPKPKAKPAAKQKAAQKQKNAKDQKKGKKKQKKEIDVMDLLSFR